MNVAAAPRWLPEYLIPFFTLSYPTRTPLAPDSFPDSRYYGTGKLDLCFVVMWIGALAILREVLRLYAFEPFARWWLTDAEQRAKRAANGNGHSNGHSAQPIVKPNPKYRNTMKQGSGKKMTKKEFMRERSVLRFGEQGWAFIYCVVYWSYGMYIHTSLPTAPWNLEKLWLDYPHTPLAEPVKFYYLTSLAFWFHQVFILNAEEWRKDHWQMMTHHVVTIALVSSSYFGGYTRVGCLIMVLMDWCDIWLAFAKMTKYLGFTTFCDAMFGVFIISWFITRQGMFVPIIISVYHTPDYIEFKWDPEKGHYFSPAIWIGFLAFLITLLVLLCMWSYTAAVLTFKVLSGAPAEDSRSDDEIDLADDDEADEEEPVAVPNGKGSTLSQRKVKEAR